MTVRRRVLALVLMAGVVAVSSALAGKGAWFLLTSGVTALTTNHSKRRRSAAHRFLRRTR
jgi:hypothetical protein